jgi:EAL domain-containing protein (putative c-di-GMP-specific phosphodiesterase class I)/DNA-binding response OmpR family regulator
VNADFAFSSQGAGTTGRSSAGHEARVAPRILVVDDQVLNAELLVRVLERAGYNGAEGLTDSAEALRRIDRDELDLVLLDLRMPGIDGFTLLERIRARSAMSFLPVIVLTGDVDAEARRRALGLGATDFLVKPFDVDEVVLRCRNLLELRRLHRQLAAQNAELRGEVSDRTAALDAIRRERAQIAEAFAGLRRTSSTEEAAAEVCAAVVRVTGVPDAMIVALRPGGSAVPLATAGNGSAAVLGRALSPEIAARLRDRASGGPWIEESTGPIAPRLAAVAPRLDVHAPIRSGSEVVGVLIAGSAQPVSTEALAERMPAIIEFAALAGPLLGPSILAESDEGLRAEIAEVLETHALRPVFQPIVDLESGTRLGFEALTRFGDGTPPDRRIADAASVGLGVELELECVRTALGAADALPDNAWLSLNVSPDVVLDGDRLQQAIAETDRPLVLEVTEHVAVGDYAGLRAATDALRPLARIAIDDAGAGYSSFRHIVELQPDFVKLDIGLVRSIEHDRARQALVAGMDYFALKTGCTLIAEGIETKAECDVLRSLAIELGQGYLLGRPGPAA